ncbi:hypothetical protein [Tahibacter amnicola]|uniref:Copper chaperone CopZ n=1 Tax=Tahibacter amnicola TaxID=2976241 RepID=A0ABY6BHS0_9GAMM|nr:hypothetical protein [Tahibacter amnicola]UXI68156.1 hypothetical protein N4264_00440 [Tahibacter amnicola]
MTQLLRDELGYRREVAKGVTDEVLAGRSVTVEVSVGNWDAIRAALADIKVGYRIAADS